MLMGGFAQHLADANSALYLGWFKPEEGLYMKIPLGFEKVCPWGGLLFTECSLYGVKNATKAFWE